MGQGRGGDRGKKIVFKGLEERHVERGKKKKKKKDKESYSELIILLWGPWNREREREKKKNVRRVFQLSLYCLLNY